MLAARLPVDPAGPVSSRLLEVSMIASVAGRNPRRRVDRGGGRSARRIISAAWRR